MKKTYEIKKQKEIDNFFKTASPKKKIDYKKLAETIKEINKSPAPVGHKGRSNSVTNL